MCPEVGAKKKDEKTSNVTQSAFSSLDCSKEVVLQTLMVKVNNGDKCFSLRAIIDSGSQRSYILKKTAELLELKPTGSIQLRHILFGCSTENRIHRSYDLKLENPKEKSSHQLSVLDHDNICGNIPRLSVGPWLHALKEKKIWISDLGTGTPQIDLLIGADCYGSMLTGRVEQLENGLSAIETKLGWTLVGATNNAQSAIAMTVTSMYVSNCDITRLWELDVLGIQDRAAATSKEEKEKLTMDQFLSTISRSDDGRYSVSLPWISGVQKIPDNRYVAEKRLINTTAKLNSKGMFHLYDQVFKSWLNEGVIELVPECEVNSSSYYLPHRAVIKPESLTTPIRPVFDASCRSGRSPSLNDCLEKGPNLLELLPAVLLRFRIGLIGVVADIRKAFLMIEVHKSDRDFLRFLWWDSVDTTNQVVFRHKRVVFGVNSSPFLLAAVIQYHISTINDHRRESAQHLLRALYVDNCVTSVNSVQELQNFKKEATEIMSEAKMELRQWAFTAVEGSRIGSSTDDGCGLETGSGYAYTSTATPVLGMKWNLRSDTLFCEFQEADPITKVTKRIILSSVQKVFDPVGYLCPVLVLPKIMLQETWVNKVGWDDELSGEVSRKFLSWWEELSSVSDIQIPRNVTGGTSIHESWQLHCFCDASKLAFATVVFLRCQDENGVSVQLLQAKSRAAPIQTVSIPRLELMACLIGARLTESVSVALDLAKVKKTFWSDSSTALSWIKDNDCWGTFVGNRVRDILSLTKSSDWKFVPGIVNPADLPSRGCSALELQKSKWWDGPEWLKKDIGDWPCQKFSVDYKLVRSAMKKCITSSAVAIQSVCPPYLSTFSSLNRNLKVIAFVSRFIHNCRCKKESRLRGPLSSQEIEDAELRMVKKVQNEAFPDKSSVISGIQVVQDTEGFMRVKTRLLHRDDSIGFRLPLLLPNSHPFVDQLIRQLHLDNSHGGIQFLISKVREKYWILQARRAVSRVVSKCVTCRRFNSKPYRDTSLPMLPEDRVKTAKVFEVTGLDLAGPLYLKDGSKVYILLATCAVYRAVHLELLTSLSTECFLLGLQRFIDRRGRVSVIYSDNGSNFRGAENLFATLNWTKIQEEFKIKRIQWKFNPPSAPWWGGFWERLVRSMKDILKRILGKSTLTFEQLLTCVCDAEAVVNSRPLTVATENPDDLIPLTPAMFLQEITETQLPEVDEAEVTKLQGQLRHLSRVRQEIKSRFRKEYLSLLIQRGKEKPTREAKIGDVVLIGSDNSKRLNWPLARIVELVPGKDGVIRVVKLQTAVGPLTRPIQRLYPLEVTEELPMPPVCLGVGPDVVLESTSVRKPKQKAAEVLPEVEEEPEVTTRRGRVIKKPQRYDQLLGI